MKSIFLKQSYTRIIVLNGSLFQVFTLGDGYDVNGLEELATVMRGGPKSLVLLAAPYAFTYVHETISLPKNELVRAENQTLGFSRLSENERCLETLEAGREKAITLYSHLSEEGKAVIGQLKAKKIKFKWRPALSFFISNLVKYPQSYLQQYTILNLVLQEEILQVNWSKDPPLIKHFFHWNRELSQPEKQRSMERLLRADSPTEQHHSIVLDSHVNDSTGVSELIFPKGDKNKVSSIRKVTRSKSYKLKKVFSPTVFFALLTTAIIAGSLYSYLDLRQLKARRIHLQNEVRMLKQRTGELEELAEKEQSVIMIDAFKDTISVQQFDPVEMIERLTQLIPPSIWLKQLTLTKQQIHLELFDHKNIGPSALIKLLSTELGSTQIDEKSKVILGDQPVRKYTLAITPFK